MFEIIIAAIGLGLFLSFSLGPVFFELINTSLKEGFKAAITMEIGVLFSDIVYLLLALFSASKAIEYLNQYPNIKYVFGSIFLVFGIVSIIRNLKPSEDTILKDVVSPANQDSEDQFMHNLELLPIPQKIQTNYIANLVKGFGLNAVNPSVLIFWILVCSTSIKTLALDNQGILVYFSLTLLSMFGIDVIKIYFASKLQKYITPKTLQLIGITVGIIMFGVGIYIMLKGFNIPQNVQHIEM